MGRRYLGLLVASVFVLAACSFTPHLSIGVWSGHSIYGSDVGISTNRPATISYTVEGAATASGSQELSDMGSDGMAFLSAAPVSAFGSVRVYGTATTTDSPPESVTFDQTVTFTEVYVDIADSTQMWITVTPGNTVIFTGSYGNPLGGDVYNGYVTIGSAGTVATTLTKDAHSGSVSCKLNSGSFVSPAALNGTSVAPNNSIYLEASQGSYYGTDTEFTLTLTVN